MTTAGTLTGRAAVVVRGTAAVENPLVNVRVYSPDLGLQQESRMHEKRRNINEQQQTLMNNRKILHTNFHQLLA